MKLCTKKIYEVEFIQYTNAMRNVVRHNDKDMDFFDTPEPFLISEDDIEKYRNYGGGYKSLTFVGNLLLEV